MQKSTYFKERMDAIGFDPVKDYAYANLFPDEPNGAKSKFPLFEEREDGAIKIYLMDLTGELITIDKKAGVRSRIQYEPICYYRKHPSHDGPKYYSDKGVGACCYLTAPIVDYYMNRKHCETLYLTEGQIKSFVVGKMGLPIIGLPGITVWKEKTKRTIFDLIRIFVDHCKVKRVIYITDADTFNIKMEADTDLSRRPFSFVNSIKLFKKMFTDYKVDLFWKSIDQEQQHKGIDDLILSLEDVDRAELLKELSSTTTEWKYFETYNVSNMTYRGIEEKFGLQSAAAFYGMHRKIIDEKPFIFRGGKYQWSVEQSRVIQLKSEFASMLMMIGRTMYQKGAKPTRGGGFENILNPISDKQLLKICGDKKKAESVFFEMDYFDGAITIPSHMDYQEYEETEDLIGNKMKWYNMYRPVTHKPAKGSIENSMAMIKHIFGEEVLTWKGKKFRAYNLGLDYIKILWMLPKHFLPILTLYSEERQTGKTTFWDWMRLIFQQNAKQVRPEHLTSQFTSFFANSLLVTVDEAIIDKKMTMERIKGMVTAKTATMEAKYSNAEEVANYVKIGLATNNKNFASIDDEEVRFWVRHIRPFSSENFNMLEDLESEIPAFLHYINEREMTIKAPESRAWFPTEVLQTSVLKEIKKESKWRIEKDIEEAMVNLFALCKQPMIGLSSLDLKKLVDNSKYTGAEMRNIIENRMKKSKKRHSQKYTLYNVNEQGEVYEAEKSGLPYYFYINEFFEAGEILNILTHEDCIKLEEDYDQKWWTSEVAISDIKDSDLLKLLFVETSMIKKALTNITSYSDFVQSLEKTINQKIKVSNHEEPAF